MRNTNFFLAVGTAKTGGHRDQGAGENDGYQTELVGNVSGPLFGSGIISRTVHVGGSVVPALEAHVLLDEFLAPLGLCERFDLVEILKYTHLASFLVPKKHTVCLRYP